MGKWPPKRSRPDAGARPRRPPPAFRRRDRPRADGMRAARRCVAAMMCAARVPFDWNATAAEVTERVRAAMED